jgi:galactokinase
VTREDLRARFVEAGFDESDADGRARLTLEALDAYGHVPGGRPRWGWFVPGRIEIFGKHTDYAGGRSLLAAVPRGFVVLAAPRADQLVRVTDVRWRESVWIDPADRAATFSGWGSYAAVVARRLARDFPGAQLGSELVLVSDLPRAAGLSSSSALVVAMATALARRAALDERAEWRSALQTTLDLAGYLGAVENGLTFKSFAGAPGVGTHGGSEDHTAILLCAAGHVRAYSYLPVRHVGDAEMPPAWRFLVAPSGVQAAKTGGARGRYNRASLATRALVAVWNAHMPREATLAGILSGGTDAIDTFRDLLRSRDHPDFSARDLETRLQHFAAEDARVPEALRAFREADRRILGDLAASSQRDADWLLGNQIPETRELARLATESGAFAAASFGAGFGGSVWALVDDHDADACAARWLGAYRHATGRSDELEWFSCRPSPPVVAVM